MATKPARLRVLLLLVVMFSVCIAAQDKNELEHDTALLVIDVQAFYFPGGKVPLVDPEAACAKIQKILHLFRSQKAEVIHVRHNFEPGGAIHNTLSPLPGEKVISKDFANSFRETDLKSYLEKRGIKNLVICGMQTHMCVEAATRAAADMGYNCTLIQDGCATRDLKFGETVIPAAQVHASTLASLKGSYAKLLTADRFLTIYR
jgi:nicotinamidase-related amidase